MRCPNEKLTFLIIGKKSTVIVTVPAHNRTEPSSYKLKIVNDALKTLHTIPLEKYGRAPGRYKGTIPTISNDFQLVLKGKTKKNKPFKRLANGIIKPKYTIIHVFSAPDGFSVQAGNKSSTKLVFAVHCYKGEELYDVKVNEPTKFAINKPKGLNCVPNRKCVFAVSFRAPSSAKKGNIHNVIVTAIGKKSGIKASKHVQLLIV